MQILRNFITMNVHLNVLFNIIFNKYFNDTYCIFAFTDNGNNFHYNGLWPKIQLQIVNETTTQNDIDQFYGCHEFLINSNEPRLLFQKVEYLVKHSTRRFNDRRYLIIPYDVKNVNVKNFMRLFKLKEIIYVDDILIVIPNVTKHVEQNDTVNNFLDELDDDEVTFDLITNKYVGIKHHNDTVLIDKWFANNRSFLFNNNLYPDKINNQKGRELRLSTLTYPPYSVPGKMEGFQLKAFVLYGKLHKMTIKFVLDEINRWGELFDNWTGYGMLGDVLKDKADVAFGSIYVWPREGMFLDISKSFTRAAVTCLVPIPRLIDGWLTPILAFSKKLWFAVGILFLLVVLILSLTGLILPKYGKGCHSNKAILSKIIGDALFMTLKIFFEQPIGNDNFPGNPIVKYILAIILICSVLLSTSYSSGLASNIVVPRYVGDISTREDLIESKIHWAAGDPAWIFSLVADNTTDAMIFKERFEMYSDEGLRKLAYTNKYGIAIERLPGGYFAVGNYIGEEEIIHLKAMREDIYSAYSVSMAKKSSVLLPSMNDLFTKIFESGMHTLWEYEAAMSSMNTKVQRVARHSLHHAKNRESEATKLKINHLAGAFALLLFGLSLSTIIFICELIISEKK